MQHNSCWDASEECEERKHCKDHHDNGVDGAPDDPTEHDCKLLLPETGSQVFKNGQSLNIKFAFEEKMEPPTFKEHVFKWTLHQ